jgi:hypothetical protein
VAAVVTSPLVNPIAEALLAPLGWTTYRPDALRIAATAADVVIAYVASLPHDYTAVDVLAYLRGEDVPSEPLPVVDGARYPAEALGEDDDDGTMPASLAALDGAVVGHRIVSAERTEVAGRYYGTDVALVLTLDNGTRAIIRDTDDCCAYTSVESFLLRPESVDHIITGVGTTDGFTRWHIYADFGDVLTLGVGWSCGNPFYYGYGFHVDVEPVPAEVTA